MSGRDIYHDIWGSAGGIHTNLWILARVLGNSSPRRLFKFLGAQIFRGRVKNAFRRDRQGDLFLPKSIIIEPSYDCDLNCRDCYAPKKNSAHLSTEQMESIINQAEALGVYRYVFMGGEPLLKETLDRILPAIEGHRKSFFTFCTNGTQVDSHLLDRFKRIPNVAFLISLEGNREQTDARRGSGTYGKVMGAVSLIRKRRIPVALTMTLDKDNWQEQLSFQVIGDYVKSGGIVIYTHQTVDLKEPEKIHIDPVELLPHYQRLVKRFTIFLTDGIWGKMTSKGIVPRDLSQVIVDPKGNLRPRRFHLEESMGNLNETSLRDILTREDLQALKQLDRIDSSMKLQPYKDRLADQSFRVFPYSRRQDRLSS